MSNFSLKLCAIICLLSSVACGKEPQPVVAEVSEGELIFNKNCKACHALGINGAPILGNKAMWEKRVTQGIPVLVEHASNGHGLMPAKGGNMELSETDIEKAIRFMVSKIQ